MYLNLIKNAKKEIIFMFPTINAFNRQVKMGVLELSKVLNIKVRILVPAHKSTYQTLQRLRELHSNFHVRYIEQTSGISCYVSRSRWKVFISNGDKRENDSKTTSMKQ